VRRCAFASCGGVTETIFSAPTIEIATNLAVAPEFPRTIVTDGAAAYWVDLTSVHSVPLAGGPVTMLASGLTPSFGLNVGGQRVAACRATGR
jgi:hypothetical protein